MKSIKYIGFYNAFNNINENRNTFLSATNKMDYIASKLKQIGMDVEFVSPSWTNNNKYYKGKTIQLEESIYLKLFPTLPWNKYSKILSILYSQLLLFLFLLFHTSKNEKVIAYHSLFLMYPLYYAKKIRRFNLILEVEEIYQDVNNFPKPITKMENKMFGIADQYIFSTELLNENLNIKNKPYSVIYGTYQVEEERKFKFDDDKIHVVYAGTFDPKKGGSAAAAAAAAHLDSNYHVHIIGFGSEKDIKSLKDLISDISKKTNCTLTYDGLLKGEEYIQFIQSCDIGLSTQQPEAKYNETSFPSKVLSYLSNGLRVVSIRIRAIEESEISDLLYFYDNDSPEEIASTIKRIDFSNKYDSREKISKLSERFVRDIKELIK
ncbi:glycosyltransferase [Peribacillus butanolivorans]|uniref:glycosyltransferase n=1 Tax=Peribacillus butanolivorans TaxID=421767 RepID=UPI001CC06121|nr:glycosyltransferase [Peribacillus butanolivorans]